MSFAPTDPRQMNELQRRREIIAILSAGLVRMPPAGRLPPLSEHGEGQSKNSRNWARIPLSFRPKRGSVLPLVNARDG